MGNDSTKFAREVRKACRARYFALSGIGVPLAALSAVQRMIFFCARQITPQTFSIITQPIPPPMPMASRRLLSQP